MSRKGTKPVTLTVAFLVITSAFETIQSGETVPGIIALAFGFGLILVYQYIEDKDHRQAFNEGVEELGAEYFEQLAYHSADEIARAIEHLNDARTDGGKPNLDEIGAHETFKNSDGK